MTFPLPRYILTSTYIEAGDFRQRDIRFEVFLNLIVIVSLALLIGKHPNG